MVKQQFHHVSTWVFDLDNTLYPPRYRLFDQIEVRMTDWVMQALAVDRAEANRLRQHYWDAYGTTLAGLMREHGIDPAPYLQDVHDIDFTVLPADPDLAARIRDVSIAIYLAASEIAREKGIIIADTKFEFGLDDAGKLVLMDEVLTPDSSRYWPAESYQEGSNPPSFDKQFLRDWLEQAQVDGRPWGKTAPAPKLPDEVIAQTAAKYREAMERLTA